MQENGINATAVIKKIGFIVIKCPTYSLLLRNMHPCNTIIRNRQADYSLKKLGECHLPAYFKGLTRGVNTDLNILSCLLFQATLSEVEKIGGMVEQELRSKVREFLMLEGEMEHLERQTRVLHDRCASIRKENTELQIGISEEEENARMALAGFNTYRNKMEVHRAAVLHAASQTEAHKELEEKRALVRMLTQKKEELKVDLEDPNGNTVQMAKVEKTNWMILNYIDILNITYHVHC